MLKIKWLSKEEEIILPNSVIPIEGYFQKEYPINEDRKAILPTNKDGQIVKDCNIHDRHYYFGSVLSTSFDLDCRRYLRYLSEKYPLSIDGKYVFVELSEESPLREDSYFFEVRQFLKLPKWKHMRKAYVSSEAVHYETVNENSTQSISSAYALRSAGYIAGMGDKTPFVHILEQRIKAIECLPKDKQENALKLLARDYPITRELKDTYSNLVKQERQGEILAKREEKQNLAEIKKFEKSININDRERNKSIVEIEKSLRQLVRLKKREAKIALQEQELLAKKQKAIDRILKEQSKPIQNLEARTVNLLLARERRQKRFEQRKAKLLRTM